MSKFVYGTRVYEVPRIEGELSDYYRRRLRFIARRQPNSREEFEEAVRLSFYQLNVEIYDCRYADEMMTKLKQ